jgi:hypothetical protein
MKRREFLAGLAAAPVAMPALAAPATLPMRAPDPRPLFAIVSHLHRTTAITRVWEPGAVDRCRLCVREKCSAYKDVC